LDFYGIIYIKTAYTITPFGGDRYMCDKEERKKMNATLSNKSFQPLNKEKKALLKKFIGSASSKLDLNKVRDEWKYEKN
jgi:hypothetical protein